MVADVAACHGLWTGFAIVVQWEEDMHAGGHMKRGIIVLLVIVVVGAVAVAQPQYDPGPVKVDLSAGVTSSIFAAHWNVTPSAVYRFGIFGVGAGLKTHFGIGHDALYLGPYVRGEIGWFYLGLGPLFLLQQPSGSEWAQLDDAVSVIVPTGFQIPLVPIGPGRLGVDLGLDFSLTTTRVLTAESDSIIGTIIGTIVATTFGAVMNSFKANAGVFYTVRP